MPNEPVPAEAALAPVAAPSPTAPQQSGKSPKTLAEFDAQIEAEAAAQAAAQNQPEPPPAPEPVAPEAQPAEQSPVDPQAPEVPETPPEPIEPTEAPKRLRIGHLSEADRAQVAREVEVLRELKELNSEATLADARAFIENKEAEAEAAAEIAAEEAQAAAIPASARDARITEIRGLLRAAGKDQSLYSEDIVALQEELDTLREEQITDRLTGKVKAETAVEAQAREFTENSARIKAQYPTANDRSQPLGKMVESIANEWMHTGDPRWKGNPEGPTNVVTEAVERMREAGVPEHIILRGKGAKPATPAQPPAPKPPTAIASPAKGPGAPVAPVSNADLAKKSLNHETLAEIDARLFGGNSSSGMSFERAASR